MSTLTDYFGRLHPLVIHFPIALLLVAALLEGVRVFKPAAVAPSVVTLLLGIGAIGALAAAGSGWVFAEHSRQPPDLRATLYWHRWLGVGTAILAVCSWLAARAWGDTNRRSLRWVCRVVIFGTAAILIAVSHLGAVLVWGADYFEP